METEQSHLQRQEVKVEGATARACPGDATQGREPRQGECPPDLPAEQGGRPEEPLGLCPRGLPQIPRVPKKTAAEMRGGEEQGAPTWTGVVVPSRNVKL